MSLLRTISRSNSLNKPECSKVYADDQTDKLAVIINETIVEPMERHFLELKDFRAVREEVTTLRTEMQKIKTALHLS